MRYVVRRALLYFTQSKSLEHQNQQALVRFGLLVPELFSGKEKSWNKAKSYNLTVVVLLFPEETKGCICARATVASAIEARTIAKVASIVGEAECNTLTVT